MTRLRRSAAALLILALLLTGARLGCSAIASAETRRIVDHGAAVLEAAATGLPPELQTRLREGLALSRRLAAEDRLSAIARDTLRNRTEVVLADGVLAPREAEHLLLLIADLPAWKDSRDAHKYMGQR